MNGKCVDGLLEFQDGQVLINKKQEGDLEVIAVLHITAFIEWITAKNDIIIQKLFKIFLKDVNIGRITNHTELAYNRKTNHNLRNVKEFRR